MLRDPALDDDTKERTARRSALILLAQFGIITAVSVAVFAIPAAAVWLADLVGFATMGAVWKTLFEPRLITGAALFFFVLVWIQRR
ncbi:hypothetical protein H0I76_11260 [Limibaculum sp. M0105]|uniref:Uncharacterized protein n=1 Tax=Thermohalobaculum xanthum TaxID=2753746 RepID=A0A8J7M743_9RHOB|nr:hypothetical protein [Thermohalobaculum xanthum]MBK0399769.1 hypothetical protein [Thermohalobaculum xanthum]